MIEIYNNFIVIPIDSNKELVFLIRQLLTVKVVSRNSRGRKEISYEELTYSADGSLVVPIGFLNYLPDLGEVEDKRIFRIPDIDYDSDEIASILPGITLREDQVLAISLILKYKRGILQTSTGSGKTEVMAGFIMFVMKSLGYCPSILILEPTNILVESTVSRLEKYGIPVSRYSEDRGRVGNGVYVTHPMSLNNDLDKNPDLLEDLDILLSDEGHHMQSNSWLKVLYSASKLKYAVAVSASVVDQTRIPITRISNLEESEAVVVGATGDIILNIPASYYISSKILAKPVYYRLYHLADEKLPRGKKANDWHSIRKYRLESESRNTKICEVSNYLATKGYKTLILVGTKAHANAILKELYRLGAGNFSRCSFGGGQYLKYTDAESKLEDCSSEDTMERFESGELKILIGTSHLYEGADIPNLDCIVLASVGKGLRKCIQGVGRGLRRTKKGNYAHIIDFTDHSDYVLSKQSTTRLDILVSDIGVNPADIYSDLSIDSFKSLFDKLEN